MPKYLQRCRYTAEGLKGLQRDGGTGRKEAVANAARSLGAKIEAMYFTMGEDDAIIIVDAPDDATMTAASIAVGATGTVRIQTVPLLTPEDIDRAVKQKINYRAPGQ